MKFTFFYWARNTPWHVRLRSGSAILTKGTIHQLKKIIVHPKYRKGLLYNDIALLFVYELFEFSNAVKPVKLPSSEPDVGTEMMISGWGEQKTVSYFLS